MKFEDIEIEELLTIIEKLNHEVYDQCGDEGIMYYPFEFSCLGGKKDRTIQCLNVARIDFFGKEIWSTEESERKFDDDKNEYEPIENYLRKETMKIINTFKNIKL